MKVEHRLIALVDRLAIFSAQHWLTLVCIVIALMAGLPILAPVLVYLGLDAPANAIYWVYSFTCHQLAYRSFFLYGSAPAYSIAQLQAATRSAAPASDVSFWREFRGDANLGFKMAWCERDAAIYLAMLGAFILFGLIRTHVPALNWRVYLLFLVPMAIDGFWQLFTSPLTLMPFLPTHESTPELRVLTGALFGIATVWLVFPHVEIAMRDTLAQAQSQHAKIQIYHQDTKTQS